MGVSKSAAKKNKETETKKKRGRKYAVPDIQRSAVIRVFGDTYIRLLKKTGSSTKKKKGDLFDMLALFARAKWGSREPWRKMKEDVADPDLKDKAALDADPDPYVPGSDDEEDGDESPAEGDSDEDLGSDADTESKKPKNRDVQARKLLEMRRVLADVLRTHAKATAKAEQAPPAGAPPGASSSNVDTSPGNATEGREYDKLLDTYDKQGKGKPTRMVNYEAYAALNETDDWLHEIENKAAAQLETTSSDKAKRAVKMNARREVLMGKWEAATEVDKAAVLAHIEEAFETEMEAYNRSIMCEPNTLQEALDFTPNAEKLLARTAQVVAEGTRGAVLIFLAAPRETADGKVEVDVSTAEWASVPSALGRKSLKFSSIEKKQVWETGSRLRFFGEKLFDANWTTQVLKRSQICEDLARRERLENGIADEGEQVPKKVSGRSADEEAPDSPPPNPSPTGTAFGLEDMQPAVARGTTHAPEDDAPAHVRRRRNPRRIDSPSSDDSDEEFASPPAGPIALPEPPAPPPIESPAPVSEPDGTLAPSAARKTLPPLARRAAASQPTPSRTHSPAPSSSQAPTPATDVIKPPVPSSMSPAGAASSNETPASAAGGETTEPGPTETPKFPANSEALKPAANATRSSAPPPASATPAGTAASSNETPASAAGGETTEPGPETHTETPKFPANSEALKPAANATRSSAPPPASATPAGTASNNKAPAPATGTGETTEPTPETNIETPESAANSEALKLAANATGTSAHPPDGLSPATTPPAGLATRPPGEGDSALVDGAAQGSTDCS